MLSKDTKKEYVHN